MIGLRRVEDTHLFVSTLLALSLLMLYPALSTAQEEVSPRDVESFGLLRVEANVDSFYLIINKEYKNLNERGNGDSLKLPEGNHLITVSKKYYFDSNFNVNIEAGKITEVRVTLRSPSNKSIYYKQSSYPRIYWDATLMIFTDEESDIYVDGVYSGQARLKLDLIPGEHEIVTVHRSAGSSKRKINVTAERLSVLEMYNKPRQGTSRFLTVIPGGRQYYHNKKTKGAWLFGGTIVCVGAAVLFEQSFKTSNTQYLDVLKQYENAKNEKEALFLGLEAQKMYDQAKRNANRRDVFLYTAIGLYAFSLIDALLSGPPSSGYRKERRFSPEQIYLSFEREKIIVGYTIGL